MVFSSPHSGPGGPGSEIRPDLNTVYPQEEGKTEKMRVRTKSPGEKDERGRTCPRGGSWEEEQGSLVTQKEYFWERGSSEG